MILNISKHDELQIPIRNIKPGCRSNEVNHAHAENPMNQSELNENKTENRNSQYEDELTRLRSYNYVQKVIFLCIRFHG